MPYADPERAKVSARDRQKRYRDRLKTAGIKKESSEESRAKQREATRRYREKLSALGIKPAPMSESAKKHKRKYAVARRAAAREQGIVLPSQTWWLRNREQHLNSTRRWRAENQDYSRFITRKSQAIRRSTPWGRINNRIWTVLHSAVRRNSSRPSKYTMATGYPWSALRTHLEAQFTLEMSWDNWGGVWELDHIIPVSAFKYTSLDDPIFREAWALTNLRPLPCLENIQKGNKTVSVS